LSAGGGSSSGSATPPPNLACPAALPQPVTQITINNNGRTLNPVGRMTEVGNFPTGGALSPDGRFYWSVSSGYGLNDVHVMNVATGEVTQVLPLPGGYGAMVFAPDGLHAYVSGEPVGNSVKPAGPTLGDDGDVIHVYSIEPMSGTATEQTPINLPSTFGGSGRLHDVPPSLSLPSFPIGIAITPDQSILVVALNNADQAAIINLASGSASTVAVGGYPYAAAIDPSGLFAYISNAYDGTLSKIDISSGQVVATIHGLGGPAGDSNSQPQFILPDPKRSLLYVAVTNQDGVAVVDTGSDSVTRFISLKRPEGYGVAPVALALTPDDSTLYVADAGESAVAGIALTPRGSYKTYDLIGRMSTADYTHDVQVTPDGCNLLWTAARGFSAGPNPGYCCGPGQPSATATYPSYTLDMLIGRVGVLGLPSDAQMAGYTAAVDAQIHVASGITAPAGSPIVGANGGPSEQIKYVFYVIRENRVYDQIFGTVPRGNGDPSLELLEDNCGPANTAFEGPSRTFPGCGTTPNAHALSRDYILLDNFYEDSEVSADGHIIATSAYANDETTKNIHDDYANRGRPADEGVAPISFPPQDFLFDQAVRQNISFRNYGELSGGSTPALSDDGRPTYLGVIANLFAAYSPLIGCLEDEDPLYPNSPSCTYDSGLGIAPPLGLSRIDTFNAEFQAELLAGIVPQFNLLLIRNDHTTGAAVGKIDPLSEVADNDLGVGQLVDLVSHSSIWSQSVIFVIEDDSQDGADHVDAHRAPALVAGPYIKRGGAVVHTHYDQYSLIRTMEMILGMQPLSLNDALAVPMYDIFTNTPDNTPYSAITPEFGVGKVLPASAANAADTALTKALPYDRADAVPQAVNDAILWRRVFGLHAVPPRPGPQASKEEHERAETALRAFRRGQDVKAALQAMPED
jgi:DNA-binding beta-propeller fold protein YncE